MIKLSLDVETPLTDDDRDILAGISVMMLAVANRQNLAQQAHMEDEEERPEPLPCGAPSSAKPSDFCVRDHGHSGRHKYRSLCWQGRNMN